jgi:hypothetical protein
MPHMKRQLGLRSDTGQMRGGFVIFLTLAFARDHHLSWTLQM